MSNTKICLIATFKNESMNLKLWLDHYIWQGIEHFYLIDNESNDEPLNILQQFIDNNTVTYDLLSGDNKLELIKNIYNKYNINTKHDWIIICDLDEYFFGVTKKLSELLTDYQKYGIIYSNWLMFGNDGLNNQPDDVRTNIIHRQNELSQYPKFIINAKFIDNANQLGEHYCKIKNPIHENVHIHLNHYPIQSKQYFTKIKIPKDNNDELIENNKNMKYFYDLNKNCDFKDSTLKLLLLNGYGYNINNNISFLTDKYVYVDTNLFFKQNQLIKFRTSNDAHIGLFDDANMVIEVILGGWDNTMSAIRYVSQGKIIDNKYHTICDKNNYVDIYLNIYDNILYVSDQNVTFLSAKININFDISLLKIKLASWNKTCHWIV